MGAKNILNQDQTQQNGEEQHRVVPSTSSSSSHNKEQKLDAGALFVLKSEGSWIHCGYHLTTSIVAPALLSLPFALASLGWVAGVICLVVGAAVTFYSYNLISLVLEHNAHLGRRHLRFRDMAKDILGPKWGRYYVGPIQFLVCYGAVVGCTLLGGQCMKAIYLLANPNGNMKLYEFVIIFGGLMLILAQMPSFHSLRHISLISLLLCLAYSACATAGSIYIGSSSSKGPTKDYSLSSKSDTLVFGFFNSVAIIATTYGNGIIPEIQATIAPPVKGKMFKGLCICYTVVTATFFSVAISGYWAFGNQSEGLILSNFLDHGKPLLPKGFIMVANIFTILQLSAVAVVYLQPTNEVLESAFSDPKSSEFATRNVIPRVLARSMSVIIATTIAAMLPFFGDINALIGAFGFLPLDFVLQVVFGGQIVMGEEEHTVTHSGQEKAEQQQLDAGALFVLKSEGSWIHCGYHLTTSIVAPALLSLPFAFANLGWAAGLICLAVGAVVTFYSYTLISLVLEHHAHLGRRHLRFRDMANDILGPRWGRLYVGPIQFMVCYGAVIASILLGGQSLKAIYLLANTNGNMKLYEFVIIFGGLMLILAQMPSFHSLRHISFIALLLCLAYSACATAGSIYIGTSPSKGPEKDYTLSKKTETLVPGLFNAMAIIATTYGSAIIPEIQATIAPPTKGKMFKGLCLCYAVVLTTFFAVAISGYWAFGNRSDALILTNFLADGKPLLPKGFIILTNAFIILQLSANGVVYLQPTNEVLEQAFGDPKSKEFSTRNVVPRVLSRSVSVVIATAIAAMLPFFGDMLSLIGAFGILPLDFVIPVVLYNSAFKPSRKSLIFWVNTSIAVVFSILSVVTSVAAVRQIVLDAKTYRLFANI